jgi:hypothetical protein
MIIPQWKPSKRFEDVIKWPLAVLFSPLIAIILFAVAAAKLQEWLMGPSWYWRPWFAWHFVDVDGRGTVWLEWIERRTWYNRTLYRTPGDPNAWGAADGERTLNLENARG